MKIQSKKWNGLHTMEIKENEEGQIIVDGVYFDNAMSPKRYCATVRKHIENKTFNAFLNESLHDFLKSVLNTVNNNQERIERDGLNNNISTLHNSGRWMRKYNDVLVSHLDFMTSYEEDYEIIE